MTTPIEPGPLADAWQRVDWADSEGEGFGTTTKEMILSGVHAMHVEWEDAQWEATYHVFDPAAEAIHLTELARALGSFLDHARAALNYTAFQIACLAIREDPSLADQSDEARYLDPRKVEFPIFNSRTVYRKQNRIKRLPEKYRGAIEGMQPYNGGRHALWVLHELAAEYRHHVIHPAAIAPVDQRHAVLVNGVAVPPTDLEIISHDRLEHGDLVLRFNLPNLPANTTVEPQVALTIGIDHPDCRGVDGITVMTSIIQHVGDVMSTLETMFFQQTRFDVESVSG